MCGGHIEPDLKVMADKELGLDAGQKLEDGSGRRRETGRAVGGSDAPCVARLLDEDADDGFVAEGRASLRELLTGNQHQGKRGGLSLGTLVGRRSAPLVIDLGKARGVRTRRLTARVIQYPTSLALEGAAKCLSDTFLPVLSRRRGSGALREPKSAFCLYSLCRMDEPTKALVVVSQARGFNNEPPAVWRCPVSSFVGGS